MKFFGLVLDHVSKFPFLVVSDRHKLAFCRVLSDSEDGVDTAMLSPTARVDKGLPSSSSASCDMVSTDAWDWTETVPLTQWEHWFAMEFQDESLEAWDPCDSPRSKVWKAAQQSQFFAWSLHSPAPELQEGSAAFASPGTPSEKEWICDEEWEKDDLPPTPLSPLSRDLLRGKRQLAEELESETPTEDEDVSASAQPAPRMKISDRLAKVKSQPVRVFKHGNCPRHGCALRPHVWSGSARKRGQAALVCSKFFSQGLDGKPGCWFFKPVGPSVVSQWDKFQRQKFNSLQNRLLRGGQVE